MSLAFNRFSKSKKTVSGEPKPSKKGNVKVEYDGYKFDSKKERDYYIQYKQLQESGDISGLELQPKFVLMDAYRNSEGKAVREMAYFADFKFTDTKTGRVIIIDVKASPKFLDPVYKIKKKLLLNRYRDINFKEVF